MNLPGDSLSPANRAPMYKKSHPSAAASGRLMLASYLNHGWARSGSCVSNRTDRYYDGLYCLERARPELATSYAPGPSHQADCHVRVKTCLADSWCCPDLALPEPPKVWKLQPVRLADCCGQMRPHRDSCRCWSAQSGPVKAEIPLLMHLTRRYDQMRIHRDACRRSAQSTPRLAARQAQQ